MSKSYYIVERLIGGEVKSERLLDLMENDDPFGHYLAAYSLDLGSIFEAWQGTFKEQEIVYYMKSRRSSRKVAGVTLGDYDFVLWKTEIQDGFIYTVSLNSAYHNPGDPALHHAKVPVGNFPVQDVANQLKKWVDQYGKVVVGSVSLKKLNSYRRLVQSFLGQEYNVRSFTENPDAGFIIERKP